MKTDFFKEKILHTMGYHDCLLGTTAVEITTIGSLLEQKQLEKEK